MTTSRRSAVLLLLLALPSLLQAQEEWQPISQSGILRANALVDSVFIDRLLPSAQVDGGDFAAYLMARLGANPLPDDFRYRVLVDSAGIRIGGTVADLPPEARAALAQLVLLFPPETRLEARVELLPAGPQGVRFHLRGATVEEVPVPEALLAPMMASVGARYPALTASGRDLYVRIPSGGGMSLAPPGIALRGP